MQKEGSHHTQCLRRGTLSIGLFSFLGGPRNTDTSTRLSEDNRVIGFIAPNFTVARDFLMQLSNLLHWLRSLNILRLEQSQKVTSLEAFRIFAFLSSRYHAVPSWGFVLLLENAAKIVALNTLPTAFLLPLLSSGLPRTLRRVSPAPLAHPQHHSTNSFQANIVSFL